MGRHKDPEINSLIENLKIKGESWGFIADAESKILEGLYWVDLVWKYRENQSLFITFEIEKEENNRLLKNLCKIVDTPAEEVEKPYYHFLIIFSGKLSEGIKKIVVEKARRHNIHLFENLKNLSSEQDRLSRELEQLQIKIPELIKRRGKTNAAKTIHEVLSGLKDVVPILKIDDQAQPISQSMLTSAPIVISQSDISTSPIGSFDSAKYDCFALIPIPKKQLRVTTKNTAISLNVVLRRKEESDKEIRLSFEASEIPCELNFVLLKGRKGGGFDIRINPNLADVVQVKKFEDLLRAYHEYNSLLIKNQENKVVLGAEGIRLAKPLSSDEWYKAISDLAYIQEKTYQRIPCPKDMKVTPNDLSTIIRIKKIIEKGEENIPIANLTVVIVKEQLEKLVENQQAAGRISNLSLNHEQHSINVVGEEVLLGPVTWILPDMIFKEPAEQILKRIREIETDTPIEMTMVPASNNEAHIIYQKWKVK